MPKKYARTCRHCQRKIPQGKMHFELFLISSWKGSEDAHEQMEPERGYFCSPGCVINFVVSKKVLKKFIGSGSTGLKCSREE